MDIGAVMLQLVSVFAGSNPACSTSAAWHTSFVWGQGFAALLPFFQRQEWSGVCA